MHDQRTLTMCKYRVLIEAMQNSTQMQEINMHGIPLKLQEKRTKKTPFKEFLAYR